MVLRVGGDQYACILAYFLNAPFAMSDGVLLYLHWQLLEESSSPAQCISSDLPFVNPCSCDVVQANFRVQGF